LNIEVHVSTRVGPILIRRLTCW